MGRGSEANRHFLNDASHHKREDDKRQKEPDAEAGSGRGVRQHAGAVVFPEHDENARADQKPEQTGAGPQTTPGASFPNPLAVMGTIDVFVGNDDVGGGVGEAIQQQ